MWSALPTRRYLLLSGGKAYVREAIAPWGRDAKDLFTCSEEEAGEALAALPKMHMRARLEVVLGSAHCRFVTMDRPQRIRASNDSLAVLRAHAAKRLGLKEADWTFVADNRRRRQIVGCAVRRATLAKIEAWVQASDHLLRAIRPLVTGNAFAHGIGSRGQKDAGWVVIEQDAVSAVAGGDHLVKLAGARTIGADSAQAVDQILLTIGAEASLRTFALASVRLSSVRNDFFDLFNESSSP